MYLTNSQVSVKNFDNFIQLEVAISRVRVYDAPPCTGPFSFFVPLFVPVQYLSSIFFNPFHQSLPLSIFYLVFGFSVPIPLLLFPISCSSFSYSPVEVPSQEYTIFPVFFHCVFDTSSSCIHLFTVYCHYFLSFITYMNFSFRASFFFSLSFSLFFNPQFHPSYYSPGSSFLLIFSFCPLTPFRFPFSVSIYLFIHLLFVPVLVFSSSPFSKKISSVSPFSHPI
jgi:hypothetical protein